MSVQNEGGISLIAVAGSGRTSVPGNVFFFVNIHRRAAESQFLRMFNRPPVGFLLHPLKCYLFFLIKIAFLFEFICQHRTQKSNVRAEKRD